MQANVIRVREDLIVTEQKENEKTYTIIKDPRSQRFFRMRGEAYLILHELNGASTLEAIQNALLEKHGLTVSVDNLERFVQDLGEKHLLHDTQYAEEPVQSKWFDPVHLRVKIKLLNPDRLLTVLSRFLRFLFTPYFMAVSLGVIVFAVGVTAVYWQQILKPLGAFERIWELILLLAVVQLIVISVHEVAHGLACKHFGGEVNEIGIMFLSFVLPCVYCNLSDIHLLESKKKRVGVLLAGSYSGLVLWGIGAVVWFFVPGAAWKLISSTLMINAAFLSLINLNPLVTLDGYYILSEWVNIPNLRMKAFRFLVGEVLTHHFVPTRQVSKKEKATYVIYATLSLAFNILLLLIAIRGVMELASRYL